MKICANYMLKFIVNFRREKGGGGTFPKKGGETNKGGDFRRRGGTDPLYEL